MSNWNSISKFVNFTTKGITPSYVEHSSIIVLNQKCIRNNKIDYSFSQYTDDTKNISSILNYTLQHYKSSVKADLTACF